MCCWWVVVLFVPDKDSSSRIEIGGSTIKGRGTMKKFTESQLKVAVVTKDNAEQLKDIETIELGMALEQQEQWRQISNL